MQFISADTIVLDPNNPQTLNRYAYTLNNPMRYTDPTGNYADGCFYCGGGFDQGTRLGLGTYDYTTQTQTSTFNLSVINPSTVNNSANLNRYSAQNFDFSRELSLSDPFFSNRGGNIPFLSSDTNGYYQSSSILDNSQGLDFGIPQYDFRAQLPTTFEDGASLPGPVINLLSPFNNNRSALQSARLYNGIPDIIRDFRDPDAFTFENNIYFAPGAYNPNTASGLAVIGHEGLHIQQFAEQGTRSLIIQYGTEYLGY